MKKLINDINFFYRTTQAKNLSIYDENFLEQSIKSRVGYSGCENFDNYLNLLNESEAERSAFLSTLNNSYSEFFRNPLTYALLDQYILPTLFRLKENQHSRELRVWSAGCASGQEPYSIAILAEDLVNAAQSDLSYRIFATDISIDELFAAKLGNYDFNAVQNIKLSHIRRYFSLKNDIYTVSKKIKKNIDFSCYDLLDTVSSAPPASIYGDFDLVICCNLLFYYTTDIQNFILSKIQRSIKPGGFFITGEAETAIIKSFNGFKQYVPMAPVFVKI